MQIADPSRVAKLGFWFQNNQIAMFSSVCKNNFSIFFSFNKILSFWDLGDFIDEKLSFTSILLAIRSKCVSKDSKKIIFFWIFFLRTTWSVCKKKSHQNRSKKNIEKKVEYIFVCEKKPPKLPGLWGASSPTVGFSSSRFTWKTWMIRKW